MKRPPVIPRRAAFSLVELLLVVSIIGITTMISAPLFTDLLTRSREAVSRQNAQRAVSVSSQLSGIGVAHVLPEGLGGVEATLRLLRLGVVVPDGPMAGTFITVGRMSDEDVTEAAAYIDLMFTEHELHLSYRSQRKE